ncbi:MAG: hypothetical protein KatS3mg110_2371 [Pirellulaceae bacterium]|nr:MAG: hypothetical protein KatS3mg110_2371 [Pirellulaceae bacterium]
MESRAKPRKRPSTRTQRYRVPLFLAVGLGTLAGCRFMADGQNIQGVRYFQQGNVALAMQRFQQAASADPTNADALYNLAAVYHYRGIQVGDRDALYQAEVLYNQALDQNPNLADAYRGLAVLLTQTDRPDKAFTLLKNWVAASPQNADARVELARLYDEYGDQQAAKQYLQEAVQHDPHNARAWRALAAIREKENDYAQALANYQRSYMLQADPAVAERVAALSRMVGSSAPAGTRTVAVPSMPRY